MAIKLLATPKATTLERDSTLGGIRGFAELILQLIEGIQVLMQFFLQLEPTILVFMNSTQFEREDVWLLANDRSFRSVAIRLTVEWLFKCL